MKIKLKFTMALTFIGLVAGIASADISITNLAQSYSQDFNTAPVPTSNRDAWTWTDDNTFAGWYRRSNVNNGTQTLDPDLVDYTAKGAGVTVPGFYNAHSNTNTDAAVGFLINGQPGGLKKGSVGVIFTNETGSTIQSFDVSYRGEHWYRAENDTTLKVQWIVTNSFADINSDIDRAGVPWKDASALDWVMPAATNTTWQNGSTAANGTNLSVTVKSGVNLADGQVLIIRWRIPETGTPENGLFIDDVVVDNFLTEPPLAGSDDIVMFGGLASVLTGNAITNNAFVTQIGAGEIVQWNGVNSDGGSFGASGSLVNQGVGASLTNTLNNLILTTTAISSSNSARTNTVSSGGALGVDSAGGAANFQQSDATEWSFEFSKQVDLKQLIFTGLDAAAKDRMRVTVDGVDYDLSPADTDETDSWSGAANTEVYTFPTSVVVSNGTAITISTHSAQEISDPALNRWGLFSVVVGIPQMTAYEEWAGSWGVDLVSATNNYDSDALNNYGEYVFGGNPTNGNDIGTQPTFDGTSGTYTFSLIGDNTVTAYVATNLNLVNGSWGTNSTINVSNTDGVLSNYTDNVGTGPDNLFIKLLVE